MQLPDEAIEAAAKVMHETDHHPFEVWHNAPETARKHYLDDARKQLTAAAPFIAAQAWTEGFMAGRLVVINGWPTNPYSLSADKEARDV